MVNPGSGGGDRRRVCRYSAALADAFLGWWQDTTFINVPGRLVDLCVNGCFMEVDKLPPLTKDQPVWVHFHKDSEIAWVEGRVISVSKRLLRKCEVRVSFLGPLPYEPFKRVVYGPEYLREKEGKALPEHEQDRFWR